MIIGVLESERCMISKLLSQFANEPLRVEIVPEPFGWDEIGILCSIIGTVATIIAVCVAIRANKQTAESLRYSLRMQEQSKNLNLYESRMRVLLNITEDESVNIYQVKLLFSNDMAIVENCIQLFRLKAKRERFEINLNGYKRSMSKTDTNGNLIPSPAYSSILAAEMLWNFHPEDEEKKKAFYELCEKEAWGQWNYATLKEAKAPIDEQYLQQRKVVVDMMEEYIRQSIAEIERIDKPSKGKQQKKSNPR